MLRLKTSLALALGAFCAIPLMGAVAMPQVNVGNAVEPVPNAVTVEPPTSAGPATAPAQGVGTAAPLKPNAAESAPNVGAAVEPVPNAVTVEPPTVGGSSAAPVPEVGTVQPLGSGSTAASKPGAASAAGPHHRLHRRRHHATPIASPQPTASGLSPRPAASPGAQSGG